VRAQLKKTLERLADYPTSYLGLDVAALREHCLAVRLEVAQNPDDWPLRVAALPLLLSPDRLRGDEVEIEDYRQAEPDAVTGPLSREGGPPKPPSSPSPA
jgi:hypothetical protein